MERCCEGDVLWLYCGLLVSVYGIGVSDPGQGFEDWAGGGVGIGEVVMRGDVFRACCWGFGGMRVLRWHRVSTN